MILERQAERSEVGLFKTHVTYKAEIINTSCSNNHTWSENNKLFIRRSAKFIDDVANASCQLRKAFKVGN